MTDTISLTGTIATPLKRIDTTSGISLITFRLASSQRRYDRSRGVWVDSETNWFSVSVYRQLAYHAAASLDKGDRVFVSGRLRIRNWQKDDRSGTSVEIDAESLGPDLLFGTTSFTKSTGGSASASGPTAEHGGDHESDPGLETRQGLAPAQNPTGHDHADVTPAAPGSAPATVPAALSSPVVPAADPAVTAPALVPVGAGSSQPVGAQPGWHVIADEAPF